MSAFPNKNSSTTAFCARRASQHEDHSNTHNNACEYSTGYFVDHSTHRHPITLVGV